MSEEKKEVIKTTMFKEVEQDEDVARGHVKVTELIAYDAVGKKTDEDGREKIIEKSRGPFFCQDKEDELVFLENNPNARMETFTVQLLKSTAIHYLNSPENMKQFVRKSVKV